MRNGRHQQTFGLKRQARAARHPSYRPHAARAMFEEGDFALVLVGREGALGEASPLFRDALAAQSPFPAAAICREVGRHIQSDAAQVQSRGPGHLRYRRRKMAGVGKLLALKSKRGPPAIPACRLAPLTAMLEGGETSRVVRRREGARGHPHFRRALAARSFPHRKLEGRAANSLALGASPFVRTGVVMP